MKKHSLPYVYAIEDSKLVGTCHVIPYRVFRRYIARSFRKNWAEYYMHDADKLTVEAIPPDTFGLLGESKRKLDEFFKREEMDYTVKTIRKRIDIMRKNAAPDPQTQGLLEKFTVFCEDALATRDINKILETLMFLEFNAPDIISIDGGFLDYARKNGKQVVGLEGKNHWKLVKEIFCPNVLGDGFVVEKIIPFLDGSYTKELKNVSRDYFVKHEPSYLFFSDELLGNRDDSMFKKAKQLQLFNGKNIIAVGSAHTSGIAALAKKDGLDVREMPYI